MAKTKIDTLRIRLTAEDFRPATFDDFFGLMFSNAMMRSIFRCYSKRNLIKNYLSFLEAPIIEIVVSVIE